MRSALILLAAALPAIAQPKLLVNGQVDTRAAAAGLEREFQSLLSVEPQPAWIGYAVPSVRGYNLGCDYVSPDGRSAPGVVHLEPPDQAVMLFRIVGGAVDRMRNTAFTRTVGYHLVDDAGHWVQQEQPEEVNALLIKFLLEYAKA